MLKEFLLVRLRRTVAKLEETAQEALRLIDGVRDSESDEDSGSESDEGSDDQIQALHNQIGYKFVPPYSRGILDHKVIFRVCCTSFQNVLLNVVICFPNIIASFAITYLYAVCLSGYLELSFPEVGDAN